MTRTALLIVDIQNDYFPGGRKPLPGMEAAAENATRLLKRARDLAEPVFHIRHIANGADAPFFRPGTKGSRIHAAVQPEAASQCSGRHDQTVSSARIWRRCCARRASHI